MIDVKEASGIRPATNPKIWCILRPRRKCFICAVVRRGRRGNTPPFFFWAKESPLRWREANTRPVKNPKNSLLSPTLPIDCPPPNHEIPQVFVQVVQRPERIIAQAGPIQ